MLRRGRPILRTAAVVGTASAVSGRVQHRQQEKYAAQDAEAQQQAAQAAAPPQDDLNAQLTQIAQLHDQGILTDDEFAAKKAQILGI
jgi:hypothetical protein